MSSEDELQFGRGRTEIGFRIGLDFLFRAVLASQAFVRSLTNRDLSSIGVTVSEPVSLREALEAPSSLAGIARNENSRWKITENRGTSIGSLCRLTYAVVASKKDYVDWKEALLPLKVGSDIVTSMEDTPCWFVYDQMCR